MAQAFFHEGKTRQTAHRAIADMMAITPELTNLSTQAMRSITEQVISSKPRTEQQAQERTQQAFLQHLQATNPKLAKLAEERLSARQVPSGETERSPSGAGHNPVQPRQVPSGETERSKTGSGHNPVPNQKTPSGKKETK